MVEEKVNHLEDGLIYLNNDEMEKNILKAKEEDSEKSTGLYVDLKV